MDGETHDRAFAEVLREQTLAGLPLLPGFDGVDALEFLVVASPERLFRPAVVGDRRADQARVSTLQLAFLFVVCWFFDSEPKNVGCEYGIGWLTILSGPLVGHARFSAGHGAASRQSLSDTFVLVCRR